MSGTQITATTPAGSAGAVTVTVTVNGQSGSLTNGFTYVVPPTVSSVSSEQWTDGGRDGGDDHGDELRGGSDGDVREQRSDERGGGERHTDHGDDAGRKRGSGDGNGDEQRGQSGSLANGYTYVAAPTVSSVSPNSGPTAGGTAVTITGTNFAAGATVTFGSDGSDERGGGERHIRSRRRHRQAAAGAVTVTVTVNGQSGSLANGFTYVVAPTVSSVSSEQWSGGGWDGGDDHGDELRGGSDGDVRRDGGDERGGSERDTDHGDDTGRKRRSGNGDGDRATGRAEA